MARTPLEEITNEAFSEQIESFDFPNAEITDIVKAMSELTGKNFIIDPGVRGKITILAPTKITVAEAYQAFLSALAINGLAVVPSGSFYKIRLAKPAQRDGIPVYSGEYFPNFDQMITRVVHLKHISAQNIGQDLRQLMTNLGEIQAFPQTNTLILSDYGTNIDRVMRIIEQIDVAGFDDQLEVIPVRFAKSKDMAELINRIVNRGEGGNQPRAGAIGVPRFPVRPGGQNQQGGGSSFFFVIPDERTNALIVVGSRGGIDRVKRLLNQLDFPIKPEDAGGVYVYYVRHGDAEKISQTLTGVIKEAGPRPGAGGPAGAMQGPFVSPISGVQAGAQQLFGGDVKINADKATNSLVIVASKQDYDVILNLLRRLDIPRNQVFVEAILVEMSATDSDTWEMGFTKLNSSGVREWGFNPLNPLTLANPISNTPGAILGFASGDKIQIQNPVPGSGGGGQPITINSILGFVNFLTTYRSANVLSSPQIMVMDNEEGLISVGDKVVIGTEPSTATAAGIVQAGAPKFEDANIDLKIKPFISPGTDRIRMEIEASVKQLSNATPPPQFKDSVQPLGQRKVKTNIVVPNGDTAVIGGLIRDENTETTSKVPLLGDLPVLGWLFKSSQKKSVKTNLITFLTPTVVRDPSDARKVLDQRVEERLDHIKATGGVDPYGKTMDKIKESKPSEREFREIEVITE
jgi:general secretion pathway protein D